VKNMKNKGKEYLETDYNDLKVIKTEVMLTPLLIVLPLVVAIFLIDDWFFSGFSKGISERDGELLLAIVILVGNIMFDIPFIRSLVQYKKK
jgi:hypothetical protein